MSYCHTCIHVLKLIDRNISVVSLKFYNAFNYEKYALLVQFVPPSNSKPFGQTHTS